MTEVDFAADTGVLRAPSETVTALRAFAAGERADAAGLTALEEAGALRDGAPHRQLAPALAALAAPVCELPMRRGERRGHGWVDGDAAVLVVPEPDGRLKLTAFPTAYLPGALARLNDLGPRPLVQPAVGLRLAPGDLATALASRDAGFPRPGHDERQHAALRGLLAGLQEHWRVEAQWTSASGGPGVRVVEVLDTRAGLWILTAEQEAVELWPTTPTKVFRALCTLLPADAELA